MKKGILGIFAFFVLLTGCSNTSRLQNNLNNSIVLAADTMSTPKFQRETAIINRILTIEGVDSADVVISGHTALIGLSIAYEDKEEIDRIKKEASRLTKLTDPHIFNTAVTANGEICQMIKDLKEKRQGDE